MPVKILFKLLLKLSIEPYFINFDQKKAFKFKQCLKVPAIVISTKRMSNKTKIVASISANMKIISWELKIFELIRIWFIFLSLWKQQQRTWPLKKWLCSLFCIHTLWPHCNPLQGSTGRYKENPVLKTGALHAIRTLMFFPLFPEFYLFEKERKIVLRPIFWTSWKWILLSFSNLAHE